MKIIIVRGDAPTPVKREVDKSTEWGSSELVRATSDVVIACRESAANIKAISKRVDPRFAAKFREKTQDALLTLMRELDELLPPNGRNAEENRASFDVVNGGAPVGKR